MEAEWHCGEMEALTDASANDRANLSAIDWILFRRNYTLLPDDAVL